MWQTIRIYSPTVVLRCFIVRRWFGLDSNNGFHTFLDIDCQYTHKLALACGLITISSRRTFDRRLKTISIDIKERISTIGYLFVLEGLVDLSITAVDSILMKAKGPIWHKSSMKKGEVPCLGIDTDARWSYSHTKGWILLFYQDNLWDSINQNHISRVSFKLYDIYENKFEL